MISQILETDIKSILPIFITAHCHIRCNVNEWLKFIVKQEKGEKENEQV